MVFLLSLKGAICKKKLGNSGLNPARNFLKFLVLFFLKYKVIFELKTLLLLCIKLFQGNTRPILSQVASVVKNKIQEKASNLISAASGWIKWGTSVVVAQQPQEAENVKPAPKVGMTAY